MSKSLILIFILFLTFSCEEKNQQRHIKLPEKLEKIKSPGKEPSCTEIEKKIFIDLIADLKTKGLMALKLKDWNLRFKNHINPYDFNSNDTFILLSENTIWKGTKHLQEYYNREIIEIRFKNASVTEVVLGNSIKMVQFLFKSGEDAQQATEKLKLVSYYTLKTDGLKNPNCWWIHGCAIYFCRALSASTSFNPMIEAFEKKHGKISIMRW